MACGNAGCREDARQQGATNFFRTIRQSRYICPLGSGEWGCRGPGGELVMIVNLNQYRKSRERAEAERRAAQNRTRFGRSKEERSKEAHQRERAKKDVDDKRLE